MSIDDSLKDRLLRYQRNEISEHHIYSRLGESVRHPENRKVLEEIAADELRHYHEWRSHTGQDVEPDRLAIWKYYWIGRILGFTFAARLMEWGEEGAYEEYMGLSEAIPEAEAIAREENEHEEALLQMLDEERLRYTGSIVLGLNDALVELTGALAGLTLALQNTDLIALTGSITGIAAALSMGASEYLSTKHERSAKRPLKASIYTGSAYLVTVIILILPFLILDNLYLSMGSVLATALAIIAFFSYYVSVTRDIPFWGRFLEMAGLSFGVAGVSFLIGLAIRVFLGVDV